MKKLIIIVFVLFTNIQSIAAQDSTSEIISSQGLTLNSFLRGVLGMFVLVLISYLLSANRKAINWRTVGFGLGAQVILAIGVLKVAFVQSFFEWVGSLFIAVLDFTMEGIRWGQLGHLRGILEAPRGISEEVVNQGSGVVGGWVLEMCIFHCFINIMQLMLDRHGFCELQIFVLLWFYPRFWSNSKRP